MMHGKISRIAVDPHSALFSGMGDSITAARYHSLAVAQETLPEKLRVTARSEDGEVMAVEDERELLYGVQFHPESVMTPQGKEIIRNFLRAGKKKRP